jgi:type II secretory ATPase GspE/PulE/Tfp pilus assembly ATPase PilB-like protein
MQKLDHCFQLEIDSNEVGSKVLENLIHFNPSMLVLFDFFPKNYHADFFKFCQQGKLVLELQCKSYNEMMQKIRDEYVNPDDFIREYLRFIVFHKTAKPLCPACKEIGTVSSGELFPHLNLTRSFDIYREIGCGKCHYSGFGKDKTFYEVFLLSDDDRQTFSSFETQDYLRIISEAGNMTIDNKILSGVLKGEFSYNEFIRASGMQT